ncbi:unnamed protein product [Ixodes pacificus]
MKHLSARFDCACVIFWMPFGGVCAHCKEERKKTYTLLDVCESKVILFNLYTHLYRGSSSGNCRYGFCSLSLLMST